MQLVASQQLEPKAGRAAARAYEKIRACTERLCEPLAIEDFVVQTMPDVSPVKWHLAHTSWFFETFVLAKAVKGYEPFHPQYRDLFNSYYQAVGTPFRRAHRGFLSRPTVAEIFEYRRQVDLQMLELLSSAVEPDILRLIELGLHHEEQHQELILMDIKFNFYQNPLVPIYSPHRNLATDVDAGDASETAGAAAIQYATIASDDDAQIEVFGHRGRGFAFDNEQPLHRAYVAPFKLANRLVTNADYCDFITDGGYSQALLWLDEGWSTKEREAWQAPLYWLKRDGVWLQFTLNGLAPLALAEPVSHISFYEAQAFASWAGKRLPSEFEWELAARLQTESPSALLDGSFLDDETFRPKLVEHTASEQLTQLFGSVWEWTSSSYQPYPGFKPQAGGVGEYNGKFMCNQMVLRGGSCATPKDHIRYTYRNFFAPEKRWLFGGIRLASG